MKTTHQKGVIHYLRTNFDEAAILATASKVAFEPDSPLSESDLAVMAALRRSSNLYQQATTEQISSHLREMDGDQIGGLVSNVKGILHEMEFVRLENEDGDHVYASIFSETNHPGTDVALLDDSTGETIELQLKATDDAAYVHQWIDSHPDGHIAVTEELANKLDLPSTGLQNGDLTVRTEDLVDHLLAAEPSSDVWDYFPGLTVLSVALVAWELWQRYARGEISFGRLKWTLAAITGLKAVKIAVLTAAMATPGLNVVTGALLTAYLLSQGGVRLDKALRSVRPFRPWPSSSSGERSPPAEMMVAAGPAVILAPTYRFHPTTGTRREPVSASDNVNIEGLDWVEMTVEQKVQAAKASAVWMGAVMLGTALAGPIGFFVGLFAGRSLTRTFGLWNVPGSSSHCRRS